MDTAQREMTRTELIDENARLRKELKNCAVGPWVDGEPPREKQFYLVQINSGQRPGLCVVFHHGEEWWVDFDTRIDADRILRHAPIRQEVR